MKNARTYGPIFIVVAAILWGVDGILRRSLFALPPSVIVFYEHLIGAILICPFFFAAWQREKRLNSKEWGAILLVSLLSGVLGTLCFTTALSRVNFIPFSVVFLIQKLQPIFAIGTAALLLKERVTRRYALWAALALVAAYFVTFKNGVVDFGSGGTVIAALFALGAAFAWGSSTAFSRYALLDHSQTVITALRFFFTAPLALLFVLGLRDAPALSLLTGSELVRLLMIALSTGMVALWIYYRGLKHTEAKVSTILELVFPLTAVLIDIFLYHTVLALSQYIAAVILLFAVYHVSKLNQTQGTVS